MSVWDLIEQLPEPARLARGLKGKSSPLGKGKEGTPLREVNKEERRGKGILTISKELEPSEKAAEDWRRINEEEGFEACAWYTSYHYGPGWGIRIDESCFYGIASDIHFQLNFEMKRSVRVAYEFLEEHEMFHHQVDAFTTMMEINEDKEYYQPYMDNVYEPVHFTNDCIEEALANRYVYKKRSGDIRGYLEDVFKAQPPGYSNFKDYLSRRNWKSGRDKLAGQIRSGQVNPARPFPPLHDLFPSVSSLPGKFLHF